MRKKFGAWNGKGLLICESEKLDQIPGYHDIFPAAPHKKITNGSLRICVDCEEIILKLFGCTLKERSFMDYVVAPDTCSLPEMKEAIKYVSKFIDNVPECADKKFLVYAMSIPDKIFSHRNTLASATLKKKNDFLNRREALIAQLKNKTGFLKV